MKKIIILKTIAILTLLFALADNPYGYYQLLRWFICGLSAYLAYQNYSHNRNVWLWIFVCIAVLFNPIAPIHLNRETWQPIDIFVAILFFISIVFSLVNSYRLKKGNHTK
ncbi:DUF6804 family protein [Candidatus Margulisiibacteriota bacterium]